AATRPREGDERNARGRSRHRHQALDRRGPRWGRRDPPGPVPPPPTAPPPGRPRRPGPGGRGAAGGARRASGPGRTRAPPRGRAAAAGRAAILHAIGDGIDRRAEELAQVETADNGALLRSHRRSVIPRVAHNFRFFADWLGKLDGGGMEVNGHREQVSWAPAG